MRVEHAGGGNIHQWMWGLAAEEDMKVEGGKFQVPVATECWMDVEPGKSWLMRDVEVGTKKMRQGVEGGVCG